MLENERDVSGCIEIGNKLHMIPQRVVRQFLILNRRQRIRFDNRRRALGLKMPFEFQNESVDLVKRSLPDRMLQRIKAIKVMGIVPIDLAQLKIGPIDDFPRWKPALSITMRDKLHQSFDAIKQPGLGVGGDTQHLLLAERDLDDAWRRSATSSIAILASQHDFLRNFLVESTGAIAASATPPYLVSSQGLRHGRGFPGNLP